MTIVDLAERQARMRADELGRVMAVVVVQIRLQVAEREAL